MDWAELGKDAPYLVIIVGLVMIFLTWYERQDQRRTESAKALENKREAHEIALEEKRETHDREMQNMWANTVKLLVDQSERAQKELMAELARHEKASQERYERMGRTDDLIKAIQEKVRK